ncbi:PhoH family protein [Planococcus sp. SSTMD024]|uniref:PhoH family protein n=1 Tax=Planococcus sp. SSTMD024 TaxID=3242163 RepID=UPI00351F2C39
MTENNLLELHVKDPNEAVLLLGTSDSHLSLIEESFDIHIITRGEVIRLEGPEDGRQTGKLLLEQLLKVIRKGINIDLRDIVSAIEMAKNGTIEYFAELYDEEVARSATGRSIRAKTIGQRHYIHAIKKSDMVFGIGPAGTGKTYLAVVLAVQALKNGHVKKIVLTRPAVEAGESLGFLPGDLKEKVDPYLRPLYDALHDVMGQEQTNRLIERGTIEVAPLAYMRGRTLEEAFIILDEAQNTTKAQMKMFLTRLGFSSKMIVTGDKTQIDLPRGAESGLIAAEKNLHGVKGIEFQYLEKGDVVRHPLVSRIIEAYENQPG